MKIKKIPIYVSKNTFKRDVDLPFIEKKCQPHYVLLKDFNTFMNSQAFRKKFLSLLLVIF